MRILVCAFFVVLAYLVVKPTDCLDCFSCQDVDDPNSCNRTMSCADTEVCYLDARGGMYTMGCGNNQSCGGFLGPNMYQSGHCLECCATDSCNSHPDLCWHIKPTIRHTATMCVDDESVDCAKMNTLFHICQVIHQAKLVCPKFCNLCTLVDVSWAQWSTWSNCDVTCDKGVQTRFRNCTNPTPAHGELDCVGMVEMKGCQRDPCPVRGGWSTWSSWGTCSVSCDVGMQRRDRSCSNPYPSLTGDHCFGESRDDRICMPGPCANGRWSSWGSWGLCSDSCGGGVRTRSRSCTNPSPSLLGRQCAGDSQSVSTCNKNTCPGKVSMCNQNTCPDFRNVALSKNAYQSSLRNADTTAGKAVDGIWTSADWSANCSLTDVNKPDAYWEVDLGQVYAVKRIQVLNRDAYAYKFSNITIQVSTQSYPAVGTVCTVYAGPAQSGEKLDLLCNQVISGQYVRISKTYDNNKDILAICEIGVYES